MERTFIMVKPDGTQRGLTHKVMARFEKKGYKNVAAKIYKPSENLLKVHYGHLKDKPFFPKIMEYMTSAPVFCMVWEGADVVNAGRKILGVTDPKKAAPGTIRGDYGIDIGRNVCHGSDSVEAAQKEIAMWFDCNEICDYEKCTKTWIYE